MVRRIRNFSVRPAARALLVAAGCHVMACAARAQEPMAPRAPLTQNAPAASRGASVLTVVAAQRAQDLGLPSIAADIYRGLRQAPGADRPALDLALATALLDAGDAAEAERVLALMPEPHDAAWRLRSGLAALQLGRRAVAQSQWDAIKEVELPFADLPWYRFFTGALWDTATPRDVGRANQFYVQAEAGAATPLLRARFQLAGERVRLHLFGKPGEGDLRQARDNAQLFAGQATGYEAAKNYAVMQAESGQRSDAVATLERVLTLMPPQDRGPRDDFRFVLGLIGERALNAPGRIALTQLMESGSNRERQRQALQLLAAASAADPERGAFLADLNKWVEARPDHPIKESVLFYRAQFALADKNLVAAEVDATALLKQFPTSPLRVHALTVLTQSAWEQQRYLRAADYARKARAEMISPTSAAEAIASGAGTKLLIYPAHVRADLGVLEAEASFRAKDYRTAADAYEALLREHRADLNPARMGELMFQRVLAEIKAGPAGAGAVLDRLKADPAFDLENRWQAEWNLARALNQQGEAGIKEAYTRITKLLAEPPAGPAVLQPDLRARVAWLQAKLAFDNHEPAEAIRLLERQLKAPLEFEPKLKPELFSIVMLLKARAEFAVRREADALETLKQLRLEFPETDAAISSYIIEAEHYAAQDKIEAALKQLIKLTDNPEYSGNAYVPYALYRFALLSERLGRKENLEEAYQRLEDLVKKPTAAGDPNLLFAARMRQADILRKLNQFPQAQQIYEYLNNLYGQRPDVVVAQLALADCHTAQLSNAMSAEDATHADSAQLIFEKLRDRFDAPRDVRVEAGYKLGLLLTRRGKLDEAAKVWWNDVVSPFLVEEAKPMEAEAKRPYWLARTLCELAELQEKRGRLDEAKVAYLLVLEKRLPFGEAVARSRLQQFGVFSPKSGQ